jgi:hypothetical protein
LYTNLGLDKLKKLLGMFKDCHLEPRELFLLYYKTEDSKGKGTLELKKYLQSMEVGEYVDYVALTKELMI